ncbi:MAG: TetR family transcriptional regulator C-terminal domain-containing protein, partial [Clostridia bacterium]|nr:TetR family transcriptional regulator C-terminal domain-containing protein [Clostridia bacterium]
LKAHALDSLQLHLTLSEEETEILAHYIFAGLMSVYQYWFRSNRQMPIEDLTQLVSRLSFYGVTAVLAPDLVAQN